MIRDDAKLLINEALATTTDDYAGSVKQETREIFELMSDLIVVQGLFKSPVLVGNVHHMYSLYIENGNLSNVQDAITHLSVVYPGQYIVGGAWNMDGAQAAGYTPHADLIDFMPDVWDGLVPPGFTTAVTVTDVNLLAGQSQRNFS